MALYQPTWAFPDSRNGLGQGTIDAARDLTVSWKISGPSAMTAFQIVLYTNDAASTQVYTTGRISDGCPFYGTSAAGETQFFSYTISAEDLAAAGMTNGNEYKMVITQWWSETDSVTQSSASAFITRAMPTISVNAIGTINTRYYTFTGAYAQAQGDTLNWLRWQIAVVGEEDAPFYDSGEISGTMELSAYYDGFFTGTDYAVRLSVQTEHGIEVSTGWVPFSVEYAAPEVAGYVTARCVRGTSAVYVEWSGIGTIYGTATGSYAVSDGLLSLPNGSNIVWDAVNQSAMSFARPWSVIWRGSLRYADATLFTLGQNGGNVSLAYSVASHTLTLRKGAAVLASIPNVINAPDVTVVLTPTTLYIRSEYLAGGLYPSTTLFPSATLYPRANTQEMTDIFTVPVSYTQQALTSIRVDGSMTVDYVEIFKGVVSQETIDSAIQEGDYEAGSGANDYFLADFTNGIDGTNLHVGDQTVLGFALYRRRQAENLLSHVLDAEINSTCIYDYAVQSQQGPYTYYLFPIGDKTYISQPLTTDPISPCFWDWSLMECAATADKSTFNVLAEYRFGKNLTSSAMGNNNRPNVLMNFTRYPTVQLAPQNYKSGTLSSLIGHIDYSEGARYYDTVSLMEKLYALSLSGNPLFLKDRKGHLLRVRISGEISMQTMDNAREQAQTISLPWAEVGSAEGVSLIAQASMVQGLAENEVTA